ncbi:hypothetical protein EVAR_32883_1 [Eumeta japonica]|uniref:Uncharacterized protein n=1 Tax=Eumeta variegata TaxID=151549 RepID=A0A4C1VRP3_EUMVA|nr:hypothetical protein EVAR_32883_1 [Eumeta japonica]
MPAHRGVTAVNDYCHRETITSAAEGLTSSSRHESSCSIAFKFKVHCSVRLWSGSNPVPSISKTTPLITESPSLKLISLFSQSESGERLYKADSANLPKVDSFMIANFFASNPDFCSAEFRNVKTSVIKLAVVSRVLYRPAPGGILKLPSNCDLLLALAAGRMRDRASLSRTACHVVTAVIIVMRLFQNFWNTMDKNLTPQQIEDLLNKIDSVESENKEIIPEQISDLIDMEIEASDHDTESEEELGDDSKNDSLDNADQRPDSNFNAFYGKNRYQWGKIHVSTNSS